MFKKRETKKNSPEMGIVAMVTVIAQHVHMAFRHTLRINKNLFISLCSSYHNGNFNSFIYISLTIKLEVYLGGSITKFSAWASPLRQSIPFFTCNVFEHMNIIPFHHLKNNANQFGLTLLSFSMSQALLLICCFDSKEMISYSYHLNKVSSFGHNSLYEDIPFRISSHLNTQYKST